MARRKLYLTAEAKQEANRAKSRRSYNKHQLAINARRRERYQPQLRKSSSATTTMKAIDTTFTASSVTYCTQEIQVIRQKIDRILDHRSAFNYIDMVRRQYMDTFNSDSLQEAVSKLTQSQALIYHYQDRLLQLSGPNTKEWRDSEIVRRNLQQLLHGLEDLGAHSMMGHEEVEAHYQARTLVYQMW